MVNESDLLLTQQGAETVHNTKGRKLILGHLLLAQVKALANHRKLQFLGADGGLAFVEVLRVERGDGEKKAVALTLFQRFFRVSQPRMISPSLRWIQPEGPQEDLVSLANCTSEVWTF